jgi:hypothetical protein
MKATIKLVTPADLFVHRAGVKNQFKNLDAQPIEETEARQRQPLTQACYSNFTLIESCVLLILFVSALAVTDGCFVELSHLLQSDAIRRVTIQAVQPAATGGPGGTAYWSFQF